mgnify:CR=1 FL=1
MISLLIVAGTGRPYLRAALDSLVRQDKSNWEAIVIECCLKSEDTAEVMRQLDAVSDARIRVFSYDGDRNYPPYASRKWNFALTQAKGDLVAFLDDDDMKEDNWLSAMSAPFSDLSLTTTICNGTPIDTAGVRHGQLFGHVSLDYDSLIHARFVTTGQLLVRRQDLDAIGGFDGELACAEDYDLCLRLASRPWHFVAETRCLKRDSGDNACYNPGVGGYTQAALRRIIAKHGILYECHSCGKGFSTPDESFVWCEPGGRFHNWHYGCTGLKPGV